MHRLLIVYTCILSVFLLGMGLYMIDMGMNLLRFMEQGHDIKAKSLFIEWQPDRMYHIGLLFVVFSSLFPMTILTYHIFRGGSKNG